MQCKSVDEIKDTDWCRLPSGMQKTTNHCENGVSRQCISAYKGLGHSQAGGCLLAGAATNLRIQAHLACNIKGLRHTQVGGHQLSGIGRSGDVDAGGLKTGNHGTKHLCFTACTEKSSVTVAATREVRRHEELTCFTACTASSGSGSGPKDPLASSALLRRSGRCSPQTCVRILVCVGGGVPWVGHLLYNAVTKEECESLALAHLPQPQTAAHWKWQLLFLNT